MNERNDRLETAHTKTPKRESLTRQCVDTNKYMEGLHRHWKIETQDKNE